MLSSGSANESPGGERLPQYLLYCFDGPKFVRCDVFSAPDDEAAIAGALSRHDGLAAELWEGSRKVKIFTGPEIGNLR